MSNSGKDGSATTIESTRTDSWFSAIGSVDPSEDTFNGSENLSKTSQADVETVVDAFAHGSLDKIWERCPASGKTFEESLIESRVISSKQLAEAYSQQYLLPLFDPPSDQPPPIDPAVAQLLPGRVCLDAMLAPLADDGTTLDVAIVSPEALRARDEVLRISGRQMRPMFASLEVVESILAILYTEDAGDPDAIRDRQTVNLETSPAAVAKISSNELLERSHGYVKYVLEEALERKATDIHIDPVGEHWRVRMRISGSLAPLKPPAPEWVSLAIAHLLELAGLDDRKREQPQEGTIRLNHGRRVVAIDLLTCPTIAGDKFVLKIHGRGTSARRLDELGLSAPQHETVASALQRSSGMIIVAGPSGAGKRSTLYALLQSLNSVNRNLCSVEEAIHMPLPGVNQFPARPEYGLSYVETVQAVLRRDPDVLMLSDLRDRYTASACLDATSEGKQILAAIKCGSSLHAVAMLSKLGMRSPEIAQSVKLVIGQRRVRRQCSNCRVEQTYDADAVARMGLQPDHLASQISKLGTGEFKLGGSAVIRGFESKGCDVCRGTGYRGGVVLFERIASGAELVDQIRSLTSGELPQTLDDSTLEKVIDGTINLRDAVRRKKS